MPHDANQLALPEDLLTVTLPAPGFLDLASSILGDAGDQADPLWQAIDDLLNKLPDPASFGDPWESGIVDMDHARQWVAFDEYPTTPTDLQSISDALEASYQDVVAHQAGQPPDGSGIPTGTGPGGGLQIPIDTIDPSALQDQLIALVRAQLPPGSGGGGGGGVTPGPSSLATTSAGGLMNVDNAGNVSWFVGVNLPTPVTIQVSDSGAPPQLFAFVGSGSGSQRATWLFSPGHTFTFTMVGNTGGLLDAMTVTGVALSTQ